MAGLGLSIALALGAAFARADPPSPPLTPEEAALVNSASLLDPLRETRPRANVQGTPYRHPLGLQFHPVCFTYAAADGIARADAERSLRELVFASFRTMTESCVGRYPEIRGYVRDWVAHLRRAVITCDSRTQAQLNYGAVNTIMDSGLNFDVDPPGRVGIPMPPPLQATARHHMPTIAYPRDSFVGAARDGSASLFNVNTVIHELLHNTGANNRHDHNQIENVAPRAHGLCGDDVRVDRVNMISSLCSGYHLMEGRDSTEDLVFEQITGCDGQCETLFTSEADGDDLVSAIQNEYTPTQGLAGDEASRLCQRIGERGACRHHLRTEGATITRTRPELVALGARLRERFQALFPRTSYGLITRTVLDARPGLRAAFERVASSECFRASFERTPAGDYRARGATIAFASDQPADEARAHVQAARAAMTASGKCTGPEASTLAGALLVLEMGYDGAFAGDLYRDLVLPRFRWQAENTYWAPESNSGNQRLGELLGPTLVDEYAATLRRLHWRSPDFDCEAAGLLPEQAARTAVAGLIPLPAPRSCREP